MASIGRRYPYYDEDDASLDYRGNRRLLSDSPLESKEYYCDDGQENAENPGGR